jgi:hypothetical protein
LKKIEKIKMRELNVNQLSSSRIRSIERKDNKIYILNLEDTAPSNFDKDVIITDISDNDRVFYRFVDTKENVYQKRYFMSIFVFDINNHMIRIFSFEIEKYDHSMISEKILKFNCENCKFIRDSKNYILEKEDKYTFYSKIYYENDGNNTKISFYSHFVKILDISNLRLFLDKYNDEIVDFSLPTINSLIYSKSLIKVLNTKRDKINQDFINLLVKYFEYLQDINLEKNVIIYSKIDQIMLIYHELLNW